MKDRKQKVKILLKNDEIIETNLSTLRLAALHTAIDAQRRSDYMNTNVDIDGREIAVSEIAKVQCEESDI